MYNAKNETVNKTITNTQLYNLLLRVEKKIENLEKCIKPIKKQKRYNYKQAAQLLCITVAGLKTRIKRGKLTRIVNDGTPMISHEDIEKFLRNQNPEMGDTDI